MYDRKIIYLHRYEGEMDKGNAGYIKQENRNGTCTFTAVLMNLPPSYKAETTLNVLPMGQTLCKVNIKDCKGQGMAIFEDKQLFHMGMPYEKIENYKISVSDNVYLKGEVVLPKKVYEEVVPVYEEKREVAPMIETEEPPKEMPPNTEKSIEKSLEKSIEAAWMPSEIGIYKDKWEQLSSGKKRVNLMGRESDYIEITPKDMIALSNPYHSLVNNAFLLHGYYNYKHLILGPAKGHKSSYFIGVPGNFYKQEVNAARMFGFEYFENGRDKVEVGDFGYYMKKVKL